MSERVFKDRQLPLDGGIDVLITGDGTPEDEVFLEYKSDMLIIYTGDRARVARGVPSPARVDQVARRIAAVPDPPADPDYVPPSVAEQVVLDAKVKKEEYERTVTIKGEDDELLELEPPRPASQAPKAPRDRTGAQRNALNINTTMQTSLGATEVHADLSGMLHRG